MTDAALQLPIALPLVFIFLLHRSVVAFAAGAVNIGRAAVVGGKSTLRLNTIAVGYLGDVDVEFGCAAGKFMTMQNVLAVSWATRI